MRAFRLSVVLAAVGIIVTVAVTSAPRVATASATAGPTLSVRASAYGRILSTVAGVRCTRSTDGTARPASGPASAPGPRTP
jgi:hypothetical protein